MSMVLLMYRRIHFTVIPYRDHVCICSSLRQFVTNQTSYTPLHTHKNRNCWKRCFKTEEKPSHFGQIHQKLQCLIKIDGDEITQIAIYVYTGKLKVHSNPADWLSRAFSIPFLNRNNSQTRILIDFLGIKETEGISIFLFLFKHLCLRFNLSNNANAMKLSCIRRTINFAYKIIIR